MRLSALRLPLSCRRQIYFGVVLAKLGREMRREMLVIASVSEAIQGGLLREMDCFASLAMTKMLAPLVERNGGAEGHRHLRNPRPYT